MKSNEEDIFKKLVELNPSPGVKNLDWRKGEKQGIKIKLYSWMTKDGTEKYVPVNYFTRRVPHLCIINFSTQIYYDVVVLGLTSIENRPTCSVCGNKVKFIGLGARGYAISCSSECDITLKTERISKEGKKLAGIPKSKEMIAKLKSIKSTESYKKRASKSIKNYFSSQEGLEFRKRLSNYMQERNKKKLQSGECSSTHDKWFIKGSFESKTWNKTFNYDSSWELYFIEYFEKIGNCEEIEVFDRCKDAIGYYQTDGTFHYYFPDFFIKFKSGKKLVVEIKPENLKEDSVVLSKRLAAMKYFLSKGVKYVVLTELDLFKSRHFSISRQLKKKQVKNNFNIFSYL